MKRTSMRSRPGSLSASETNIGPSAEPPIPTLISCVNRGLESGLISPECTAAAKRWMAATVLSISFAISAEGASFGDLSQ